MPEGEEVDVGETPAPERKKEPAAAETRAIVVKQDIGPDKWALRRNWMRLAWLAGIVGFIALMVWLGGELQVGTAAVTGILGLEALFALLALYAYAQIVRKRRRARVVHVRKVGS